MCISHNTIENIGVDRRYRFRKWFLNRNSFGVNRNNGENIMIQLRIKFENGKEMYRIWDRFSDYTYIFTEQSGKVVSIHMSEGKEFSIVNDVVEKK